jgi:hypothetical protein
VDTVQSVAAFAKLGETAALEARHRFEERAGQVLEEVKAVNVRMSIDRCQVLLTTAQLHSCERGTA